MSEEYLFIDCKMWVVDEGEEEAPQFKIKYDYRIPELDSDLSVELMAAFFETMATEIAKRITSDEYYEKLMAKKHEYEQPMEEEDGSS